MDVYRRVSRKAGREGDAYRSEPTVPFGMAVRGEGRDAVLAECPDARAAIARCRDLRRTPTLAATAEAMNAGGWPTARGGRWHVNTVRRAVALAEGP